MREARIILPVECPLNVVEDTIDTIIDTFAGATVYPATGHWIDPNGLKVSEATRVVDIAYKPSHDGDSQLYDIAQHFRKAARQTEVYVRYGNGHVQLVSEKTISMENGEQADLPVLEFLNMRDAMRVLMDQQSTIGERVAAFEYAHHSLQAGNIGTHKRAA